MKNQHNLFLTNIFRSSINFIKYIEIIFYYNKIINIFVINMNYRDFIVL